MKNFLSQHLYSTIVMTLGLSLVAGAWFAYQGQERFAKALQTEIKEQQELMGSLAVVTDRNGADETISSIVMDCGRRNEFEALLITLGTLSKQDLLLTQSLFESCGDFYPTQKALMVMRLEREYDEYIRLLALQETLSMTQDGSDDRASWEELLTLEKTRSELLTEQTSIQEEIINELIKGSGPADASVRALVVEAQNTGELLEVYDKRIDELRSVLGAS